MQTIKVELSEELIDLLKRSHLKEYPPPQQLRVALAIHLLQEGIISAGKAAAMAGRPRASFELLLAEMGIPVTKYDIKEYEQDRDAFDRAGRG